MYSGILVNAYLPIINNTRIRKYGMLLLVITTNAQSQQQQQHMITATLSVLTITTIADDYDCRLFLYGLEAM